MHSFLLGAIAMGCFVAGLFFFRFWRETHDRFFALFGLAFWLFGVGRSYLGLVPSEPEEAVAVYMLRLFAFGLILVAIIDKNVQASRARKQDRESE